MTHKFQFPDIVSTRRLPKRIAEFIEELSPLPSAPRRKRSRRLEKAKVLTSSPVKEKLQETTNKKKTLKRNRGRLPGAVKKVVSLVSNESNDHTKCFICSMRFERSCEEWIQCTGCMRWACVPCTDVEGPNQVDYVRDLCRGESRVTNFF